MTMPKETKKKSAPVEEAEKKNALLDADDESSESSDVKDEGEEQADEHAEAAPEKAAPAPVEKPAEKLNVGAEMQSDIANTKRIIDAEPKVRFMIPLAEGEKPGSIHQCFINGYEVRVPKGVMTDIPQSIADLLADHYKITSEAGLSYRLDLNKQKQDALG